MILFSGRRPLPPFSRRAFFLAVLTYFLVVFILEEKLFFFPYLGFVQRSLVDPEFAHPLRYLFAYLSWLLTFAALWISAASRGRVKVVYFVLFGLASLAQFGYWFSLGRLISPIDFYTAVSSSGELWRDAITLYFQPLALVSVGAYGLFLAIIWRPAEDRLGWRAAGFLASTVFLFYTVAFHLEAFVPASPVAGFYKGAIEMIWSDLQSDTIKRIDLSYRADSKPANNIVLIIDESVRADHLSLNGYDRPTTPFLDELAAAGFLANWGEAVSGATCSIASNGMLIAGAAGVGVPEEDIYRNPTLFHYAQAMGYTTWAFDAQSARVWNGLRDADMRLIDHRVTPITLGISEEVDFLVADKVREILSSSTGNLILVNKRGVHFPYEKNYPPELTYWEPVTLGLAYENSPALINGYDNALRYNVDTFFRRLLVDPTVLEQSVIFYTSDHGQTLGQIDGEWAHCGDSRLEALVPLVALGLGQEVDTTFPASHFNIFPTMVDLMGYPAEHRPVPYQVSLLEATAADRTDRYYLGTPLSFVTGRIINYDDVE